MIEAKKVQANISPDEMNQTAFNSHCYQFAFSLGLYLPIESCGELVRLSEKLS